MINRDQLNNADAERVATAAVALLDRMQNYPQHVQPLALVCASLTLADHLGVPAQDLFNICNNMLHEEENVAEFAAVRDYIKYEIKA